MHTINILTRVVEHYQTLAYVIIFLGLIFEGELVVISVGILSHLGALHFLPALFFILLGAFTKTFVLYAIGEFMNTRFNNHKFFNYVKKRVYTALPRFRSKPFWSIFISKFIMGANYLVILFCGFEKINYRKFLRAEFLSTIIWAPLLLTLGYFFGRTAFQVSREIWKFSMVVIILFILFIIFDKLVGWIYEIFAELSDSEE